MNLVYEEIPYSGDMGAVRDFYEVIGVGVTDIGIVFNNFEIIYIDKDQSIDGNLLSVIIDDDLDDVIKRFEKIGVKPLRSGFDTGGPFVVVVDPAGKKVRVSLSNEGFARSVRKSILR